MTGGPKATELLETPGALLTRTHLRELGLGRAAIDAVFRALPVVVFPGSAGRTSGVRTTSSSSPGRPTTTTRVRLTGP